MYIYEKASATMRKSVAVSSTAPDAEQGSEQK